MNTSTDTGRCHRLVTSQAATTAPPTPSNHWSAQAAVTPSCHDRRMATIDPTWPPVVFVEGLPVASGRELRALLVLALLDSDRPLTVPQLVAAVERRGFSFAGRPGKEVSDALRWEVRRGRVWRASRGQYAAGSVAKSSRHDLRRRSAALQDKARRAAP